MKCHKHRAFQANRKLARELLADKLDDLLNGDASVAAQKKRMAEEKARKKEAKATKKRALKQAWKEGFGEEEK